MSKRNGFSLLELAVAIVVLVVLAGVVVPSVRIALEDARAGKIVALGDRLARACRSYHADTGATAVEFSGEASTHATTRRLSVDPGVAGWAGPYLERPLADSDDPFGRSVRLYGDLDGDAVVRAGGFDLTGSGTPNATGAGNFVGFVEVPRAVAERIDRDLDRGVPGDWTRTGRVEWEESDGSLAIFLFSPSGR